MILQDQFLPNSLGGWIAVAAQIITSAIAAGTIVWKILKDKINSMVEGEKANRELADSRIEARLGDTQTKSNQNEGKIDLLKDQFHADEKRRLEEMGALRLEIERGFNQLRQLLLDQIRRTSKGVRDAE